jgi:hypothetical protein
MGAVRMLLQFCALYTFGATTCHPLHARTQDLVQECKTYGTRIWPGSERPNGGLSRSVSVALTSISHMPFRCCHVEPCLTSMGRGYSGCWTGVTSLAQRVMSGDGAGFHCDCTAAVDATVENTASAAKHDCMGGCRDSQCIAPGMRTFERGLD